MIDFMVLVLGIKLIYKSIANIFVSQYVFFSLEFFLTVGSRRKRDSHTEDSGLCGILRYGNK